MGGFLNEKELTNFVGTSTTGAGNVLINPVYPQRPNICPGCGRCRECGHPVTARRRSPFNPWPGYPNPYIGDWPSNPTAGTIYQKQWEKLQAWYSANASIN